jgi:hypothetical protein
LFVLRRASWIFAVAACSALACSACEDDIHKDIHGNIHVVVNRDDAFLAPAVAELERYGLAALPQIETALHSAKPDGRVRLVQVMARISQTETVPLLRHLGLFDADERVRKLAQTTLMQWSTQTQRPSLTAASSQALAWLRESRSKGLGPMVRETR